MNGTPRAINRILLAVLGLILLAAGGALVALASVPAAGRWWQGWAQPAREQLSALAVRTRLSGGGGSWLWMVVAAAMVLLAIGMVAWISNQGKGRGNTLTADVGSAERDGADGEVAISAAVAEQALKSALSERTDLVSAAVATYDFSGRPALKIRVLPRQGVAPQLLAADISALVQALDEVVGVQVPVLLSIGSGTRARFTKAERVR